MTDGVLFLVMGGDLLNGTLVRSIFTYLGLASMFFGFIACLMGFRDSANASWGTSIVVQGFSELLFGIALIAIANGLVTLAKK